MPSKQYPQTKIAFQASNNQHKSFQLPNQMLYKESPWQNTRLMPQTNSKSIEKLQHQAQQVYGITNQIKINHQMQPLNHLLNQNPQSSNFSNALWKNKYFRIQNLIIFLLCIYLIPFCSVNCTTVLVTSNSTVTGEIAAYFFTIQNHNKPTRITIYFSDYSVNMQQPYVQPITITQNVTGNAVSCPILTKKVLRCTFTQSIFSNSTYPATIVFRMTGIYNPSSTKPYPITFLVKNDTSSQQTVSSALSVTTLRSSNFIIENYSYDIMALSQAKINLRFNNYISSSTFLNVTYDSSLATIQAVPGSTYSVVTDGSGLKRFTSWNVSGLGLYSFLMNINNIGFTVSYSISGVLYFVQSGIQYRIQSYSVTIQLRPLAYSSIGLISPENQILIGKNDTTLRFSSQCTVASVNNVSTRNSFFNIQYDNRLISLDGTSNCLASAVNGSLSSCTIPIPNNAASANNTISITKIKSLIPTNILITNSSITISSFSYFSNINTFYIVCSSTINPLYLPQPLTPSFSLVSCNQTVGQPNTIAFTVNVQNPAVSDIISFQSYPGKFINKTGSLSLNYDSPSNSYSGLISGTQITNSGRITFTITFTNPTFIPSYQPSVSILISRKITGSNSTNIYAKTSVNAGLCTINQLLLNASSSLLTLSNQQTYNTAVSYTLEFSSSSIQFKDYSLNDYFLINFRNKVSSGNSFVQTDSPFQLYQLSSKNITPSVLFNSLHNLKSQIMSSSVMKITFNSSNAISLANNPNVSSLVFVINSVSNPFFISEVFCSVKTFTSLNQPKQATLSGLKSLVNSPNRQIQVSTASTIVLLEANNSLNLRFTSKSSKSFLQVPYPQITSLFYVIKAPFTCNSLNSTNQTVISVPSLTTSSLNFTITGCTLGYFIDGSVNIQVKQYARFSHTNLTTNIQTTSSSYAVQSTCTDECHHCNYTSPNNSCTHCFTSLYNTFNYLYPIKGKCYDVCPTATFNSNFTCIDCHPICASCTSNNSYTACVSCAVAYSMVNGVCESACGKSMYLNSAGKCISCHANCLGCITTNNCYLCKPGAVLYGQSCIFAQCQFPCGTCQGTNSTCLTCASTQYDIYYYYENSCLKQCPDNTFQWQQDSSVNKHICKKAQSSSIFFIGIILSIICLLMAIGLRCFSPKKPRLSLLSSQNNQKAFLSQTSLPYRIDSKLNQTTTNNKGLRQTNNMLSKTFVPTNKNNLNSTINVNTNSTNDIGKLLLEYMSSDKFKIYKLNVLRFMTVTMAYVEIICVLVILGNGGKYNPTGVNEIILVGLAFMIVLNIIFGVRYFKSVYKKLILKRQKFIQVHLNKTNPPIQIQPVPRTNQINQSGVGMQPINNPKQLNQSNNNNSDKSSQNNIGKQDEILSPQKQKQRLFKKQLNDFDNQMIKQLVIVGLSAVFTLRTYNIQRSNLFYVFRSDQSGSNQQNQEKNKNKQTQQLQQSNSALRLPHKTMKQVQIINKTQLINSKKNSPVKKNSKQINVIKIQPKNQFNLSKKQSKQKQKSNISLPIQSHINNQNQNLSTSFRPFSIFTQNYKSNELIDIKTQYFNKFTHPFYTYITISSLVLVSIPFAISSALLIVNYRYANMMLWGIDALIVIAVGFSINIWDLWKAVNLSQHQQSSQISTQKEQINQTMQNLKNAQEDMEKINLQIGNQGQKQYNDLSVTKKINTSANKFSNRKSNQTSSPSKKFRQINLEEQQKNAKAKSKANSLKKNVSPRSPTQKSDKTKANNRYKKQNDVFHNFDQKPQLKIFDDLQQIDEGKNFNKRKNQKGQKLRKTHSSSNQFTKGRTSNRTLYAKKTQTGNKMNVQTTRGKANKQGKSKLEDIFLGFAGEQYNMQNQVNDTEQNNITETDQVSTVKLQGRDLIKNIKQSSVININSQGQIQQNQWKDKPLNIVESKGDENLKESQQQNNFQIQDLNQ